MSDIASLARGVIVTGFDRSAAEGLAGFAGYLLFARNGASVEALRESTDALRARHGDLPPVLAVDQEGGRVARLQSGVEAIPAAMALGAAADVDLARRAGEQIAFDLRRAGCTLDFAPVLDLAVDPHNTVIGTRSFGDDPNAVAALGAAVAGGLRRGGIIPCYKHFPGHGATSVDSHAALPTVDAGAATLHARDIRPFAATASAAPAVMTAHVRYPSLDPHQPATRSRLILSDLLRSKLGFRGVVVTDCLEMSALADSGPVAAAVAALTAGADMLLFSHRPDEAIAAAAAIAGAVADGRLSLERLEQANARVRALRARAAPPLPMDDIAPHPGIGREISRRAITLVRGLSHADPGAALAVAFGGGAAELVREAPALEALDVSLDPSDDEIDATVEALDRSRRRPILLSRRAHLHSTQAAAIAKLLARYPDALCISLLEPFDLPFFAGARHLLAAYGDDPAAAGGLADVIFGNSMPAGRLPVALAV